MTGLLPFFEGACAKYGKVTLTSLLHSKHAIKPCIWLSDVLLFFLICELLNKGQSETAKVSKLEGTDSVIQWDRGT